MRAARPSSTAGSSFLCHTAFLTCDHKQRVRTSTSTPPLVHTNIIRHLLPLLSPRHTLFVPVSAHHTVSFNQYPTCLSAFHFASPPIQGVILPGDKQRVEFIFKSEETGIKTELWQLNTHPVLLRGASMQVTLRGVALYQDKTKDQRLFIEVVYN